MKDSSFGQYAIRFSALLNVRYLIFSTVMLLGLVNAPVTSAQNSRELKSYAPHIMAKVADINGLLGLGEREQVRLAAHFARQDSLALAKKQAGMPLAEIRACYADERALDSLLTTEQRAALRFRNRLTALEPGSTLMPIQGRLTGSLVSKAISLRQRIPLSQGQVDTLSNWLLAFARKNIFRKGDTEKEQAELRATLNNEQFDAFIREGGRIMAEASVARHLYRLEAVGAIPYKTDTTALRNELMDYELPLCIAQQRYSTTGLPEDLEAIANAEKKKPRILAELEPKNIQARKRPTMAW